MAFVFGAACPPLLAMSLLGTWLNQCSLRWVQQAETEINFGERVAILLVQPAISTFETVAVLTVLVVVTVSTVFTVLTVFAMF